MALIVFALVAYLIGSIPFAILSSRLFGLADPRTYGSGNPGATNVLRTGKKGAAAFTLIGDMGKGWAAVVLAQWLAPKYGLGSEAVAAVALAVFLGHLYPVFIGFKGGKGVATALGVLLALDPSLGLMALITWLVMAFAFRYSSLAALTAAGLSPVYAGWLLGPGIVFGVVLLISALLVWRHRANIRNLVDGKESRIGGSAARRGRHRH